MNNYGDGGSWFTMPMTAGYGAPNRSAPSGAFNQGANRGVSIRAIISGNEPGRGEPSGRYAKHMSAKLRKMYPNVSQARTRAAVLRALMAHYYPAIKAPPATKGALSNIQITPVPAWIPPGNDPNALPSTSLPDAMVAQAQEQAQAQAQAQPSVETPVTEIDPVPVEETEVQDTSRTWMYVAGGVAATAIVAAAVWYYYGRTP